jgi:hypothetical protein
VTARLPLAAVSLSGPDEGRLNTTYHFTATLDPTDAAPALFNWQPTPRSGQGTAHVTYQWSVVGSQTVTVTAHNDSGSVVGQHMIDITGSDLYLPLVRK